MTRRLDCATLTALAALSSCGASNKPTATIVVDPPAALDDDGCIGVVGFELAIRIGSAPKPIERLMRSTPVLSRDDCRLPSAASLGELPTDQPIDIAVDGYDSAHTHRVSGNLHLGAIGDSTSHLVLAGVPTVASEPVLIVNRAALFRGTALSGVQSFSVRTAQKNTLLLTVNVTADTSLFFTAVDPGAFTLTMAIPPSEDLVVGMTSAAGGGPPARVTPMLDAGGLYYTAGP